MLSSLAVRKVPMAMLSPDAYLPFAASSSFLANSRAVSEVFTLPPNKMSLSEPLGSRALCLGTGDRRWIRGLPGQAFPATAFAELGPCPLQPADQGRSEPERPSKHQQPVEPD